MLLVTHYPGKFNSYLESISKGAFESILTACIFAPFYLKISFFLLCHIINQNIIASLQGSLEVEKVFMFHYFDNQWRFFTSTFNKG